VSGASQGTVGPRAARAWWGLGEAQARGAGGAFSCARTSSDCMTRSVFSETDIDEFIEG
jgi:hypothetical protein